MADFATDFKAWIVEQASWTNDELKVVNEETEQEYFNFLSGGLAMIEAVQEWIISRSIAARTE